MGRSGAQPYLRPTQGDQVNGNLTARMLYSAEAGAPEFPAPGQARCVDGTEPFYWIGRANAPTPSHRWAFVFQGGGSCYANAASSATEPGCLELYNAEARVEMTSDTLQGRGQPARVVRGSGSSGILSPTGPFGDFHRVRISKCSFDRYLGDRDEAMALAAHPSVQVFHQGLRVARGVLDALARGPTRFQDCTGERCGTSEVPRLCDPSAPDTIVLAGHSGGAHGLYLNAHLLRAHLEGLGCRFGSGPTDDKLVLILDAQFMPMLDAYCHTDPDGCACEGRPNSIYCHDRAGRSGWFMATYDDDLFARVAPPSPYRQSLLDWNRVRTESLHPACARANPTNPARCLDRFHLAANYFTDTPFVLRESLRDTNFEHHPPSGHPVFHANVPGAWGDASWDPSTLPLRNDGPSYARLVVTQARDLLQNHRTRAPNGPLASFHVHLPACPDHEGILGDEPFGAFAITHPDAPAAFGGQPYGRVLRAFVEQVERGASTHTVLADDGAMGVSSTCVR